MSKTTSKAPPPDSCVAVTSFELQYQFQNSKEWHVIYRDVTTLETARCWRDARQEACPNIKYRIVRVVSTREVVE